MIVSIDCLGPIYQISSKFVLSAFLLIGALDETQASNLFRGTMDTITPKSGPSKPRVIQINPWVKQIVEQPDTVERMEQMIDERKLFVNVETLKQKDGMNLFNMNVNGIVHAPFFDTIDTAYQFDKLMEVSGHFKRVKYDPSSEKLFIVVEALGYRARLMMELSSRRIGDSQDLIWHIVGGRFKGMRGIIRYSQVDLRHTKITLASQFKAKKLPLPKVLMGLALEVITYKVAQNMRSFIEKSFNEDLRQAKMFRDQRLKGNMPNDL